MSGTGTGLGPIVDPSQLSCPTQLSWAKDIRPLFQQKDIDHMKHVTGGRLDLGDYTSTEIWAWKVYQYVANGYMPPGAPWSQAMVNTFGCWIQQGYPQ
jgi:hypothetical protein